MLSLPATRDLTLTKSCRIKTLRMGCDETQYRGFEILNEGEEKVQVCWRLRIGFLRASAVASGPPSPPTHEHHPRKQLSFKLVASDPPIGTRIYSTCAPGFESQSPSRTLNLTVGISRTRRSVTHSYRWWSELIFRAWTCRKFSEQPILMIAFKWTGRECNIQPFTVFSGLVARPSAKCQKVWLDSLAVASWAVYPHPLS
ncbi:hypothetical protein B0H11DRAFT_9201 [Mycena galericulata]|nr:hypothetical protein B0H11DRAFT_9201 [Mycena galericulata]